MGLLVEEVRAEPNGLGFAAGRGLAVERAALEGDDSAFDLVSFAPRVRFTSRSNVSLLCASPISGTYDHVPTIAVKIDNIALPVI